jgi:hypothetical protein
MTRFFTVMAIAALAATACQNTSSPAQPLRELDRTQAGNVDVVLLSADTAVNTGKDTVTIEFRSVPDGNLVDVGTVKGNATMPMAGMAPMLGPVAVRPGDVPGRYVATTELSMAGEWRLSMEWKGPAGQGSVTFSPMVH